MTICVAAIGKNQDKEIIVFATDRMITVQPIGQFEHSIEKFKKINSVSNIVAMLAGDALIFNKILEGITSSDFDYIKENIHKNMIKLKEEIIQKQVLDTFKIDHMFVREILKGQILNPYAQNILKTITEFGLKTNILLVGFKDVKAQISEVTEFGTADLIDINFGAIGSGAVQALNTLLFQKQTKETDLKTTLYNVYKAKRNSEVSVGVGKETDIMILTQSKITKVEENQIKLLSEIYEKELAFGKAHDNLTTIIQNLNVS